MIGVILAGGESRRFGSQKALHLLEGKPFYQHIYETMEACQRFDTIVINTNQQLADAFKYPVIVDNIAYQGMGPLAGLYTVMNEVPAEAYFIVSVDTPFINVEAIHHLIHHFHGNTTVYRDNTQIHATIGIYPAAIKEKIEQQLKHHQLRLRQLYDEHTQYVNVNEVKGEWYANINCPEDLKGVCEHDRTDNR
ncbi:molybdenum cofactor guanylyltransferase MobA [Macrococcus hajekii]|uniref:Probable molybdenum cofactor guanylyltransferase n=1 Tax=Macrococcus hajekii TaxID=198482 RepID=A0A4R6BJL4_9STAP|nr:molybdenum cofactor guanylyltransferase MobA [Macrococcus hajekii]TDM01893.1 molybdenum cofactor guanylyltransferase MobA [Macrococcus hajekii]GGB08343.1 putative molybdenum cofactor guanylyltransferase [Macrococcus hajekii]